MAESGGSRTRMLLLVLVALIGAGGWNYHQNWSADKAVLRAYRSYSDEDLARLLDAYRSQAHALRERYEGQGQASPAADPGAGLLGERIEQFEKAQQRARARREIGGSASMIQATVEAIEREQATRVLERDPLRLHLGRLVRFGPTDR